MSRVWDWPGHAWLALPMRLYLGYVFVYACLHKIAHPGSFALDVATYGILPLGMVNLTAITLPWVELAAGGMLVMGLRARAAALMTTGMMVVFMLALVFALAQGLDMSCGCFASQGAQDEDPISSLTVLRDAGWLALSLYIFLFDRNPVGVSRVITGRSQVNT